MDMAHLIRETTEHLKVYLLSGTLAAVGVDVATNVSGGMEDGMAGRVTGAMTDAMTGAMAMDGLHAAPPLVLAVKAIGALLFAVGLALYLGNMWCGYVALRRLRFRFRERGAVLQACGWSVAFLYVASSLVVGVAVNAVYLALMA